MLNVYVQRCVRWSLVCLTLLLTVPSFASCVQYYCWEIRTVFGNAMCRPVFHSAFCDCAEYDEVVVAWGTCYYDGSV